MNDKETTITIDGFEIPVKIGFYSRPALYVNLEKRTVRGVCGFYKPFELMEEFAQRKMPEIKKILDETEEWKFNNPFRFEDGEAEYILGEYYRLCVTVNRFARQKVLMDSENHTISVTVRNRKSVKKIFDKHCRKLLHDYIAEVIPELEEKLEKKVHKDEFKVIQNIFPELKETVKFHPSGFKVKKIKHAYGCCTRKGFLCFDPKLYRKQKNAVKQVVLHELCHIKEFNHKGEFFDLMAVAMPDWRKWDVELKKAFPEIVFMDE